MLPTARLQHNLVELQAQLKVLQDENSALTRDLCLKENYIQLKDQQFRVMQRRLEEVEGAVAQWKDRWLQQVQMTHQATRMSDGDRSENAERRQDREEIETDGQWTPWICQFGTTSRSLILAQAHTKLDKLSQADRNKLQPLLDMIDHNNSANIHDLVFVDVSKELSHILQLYLLPALLNDDSQQLQFLSRAYQKQTMDIKVCTTQAHGIASSENGTGSKLQLLPAPSVLRSSFTDKREELLAGVAQLAPEVEEVEAPHLFDCVELDRRGVARPSVPHGPRELHSTKAMFVSRPLSGSAAARAATLSLDKLGEKSINKLSRRYTLTPKRTGSAFAIESTHAYTMTIGALPSPAQSPSSMSVLPIDTDGEVIPTPPREKEGKADGKIKKIVGSVFDRLSRHKSHQSLTSSSSSHASPLSLGMFVGSTDVEDETICDGCGRGPLLGIKWVCRTCRLRTDAEYDLCEKCYGHGIHGKEHEDALFARVETIVVRKCPCLASETKLLHLLRVGICKANVKKFSFCLTWIADLLQCNRTTDLRARALEIAHVPPVVRSEFTRQLRELLIRYRPNIELKTEWEPAAGAQHRVFGPGTPVRRCESAPDELDTLRIWVKDVSLAATASTGATSNETPSVR